MQIKDLNSCPLSICEKSCLNRKTIYKDKNEFLCCTNQVLTLLYIDLNNIDYNIKTFEIHKRTI